MKKLKLISIVILSVLVIAFLVWFLVMRDKTIPAGEAVRDLLPFGSGDGFNIPGFQSDEENNNNSSFFDKDGTPIVELFPLSQNPVAGMIAFSRGTETVVRYVDRATGHIHESTLPNTSVKSSVEKRKITNTTLPKVYEAYFRADGGAVLFRSLREDSHVDVTTAITLIPPAATSSASSDSIHTFSAVGLRGDIGSVAVSRNNLFYTAEDSNVVVSTAFNNPSLTTIFSSLFTDWKLIPSGSSVILQTKTSENELGYAYTITTSSTLNKIVGPLRGLSVVSNSGGGRLLYSYNEDGYQKTAVKALPNGGESPISPATLAEKCTWSSIKAGTVYCGVPVDAIRPGEIDDWYKGFTHFTDRVWMFDTSTEIAEVLIEPEPAMGLSLDIISPQLSPKEDYLLFINKTDMSLWALRLPQS